MKICKFLLFAALAFILGACESTEQHRRYAPEVEPPLSILILPPINNSNDQRATYSYLSTVSEPISEAGYYVLPVAVIDAYLKANGVPNPYEMHQVSLEKLHEILGMDAVLYITIDRYGQEYSVLSSTTVVSAHAELVLVENGQKIWNGEASARRSSDSGNSLTESLINAVITQVVKANKDHAYPLTREANWKMLRGYKGLPDGPRYPCSMEDCPSGERVY